MDGPHNIQGKIVLSCLIFPLVKWNFCGQKDRKAPKVITTLLMLQPNLSIIWWVWGKTLKCDFFLVEDKKINSNIKKNPQVKKS
jgi:hypothetical protein